MIRLLAGGWGGWLAALLWMAQALPAIAQQGCANPVLWQQAASPAPPPYPIAPRQLLTIPVAVHIVWHSPQENLSDEQVQTQIEWLNRDFRGQNAEAAQVPAIFRSVLADMEIEFCLVAITRTQTNLPGIANLFQSGKRRLCYTALGGRDAITPQRCLNIWVAGRNDGACGDAPLPGQTPPVALAEDGVFLHPRCFGPGGNPPYQLGRTTTHEVGHYLNLRHLWGDGLEDPLCQSDDGLTDTPPQSYSYLGECPTHPNFSCGGPAMFMNFMNFTDDACMAMFTQGQKERAWATIHAFRPGLFEGDCLPVALADPSPPAPAIKLLNNPARDWAALQLPEKETCKITIFDQAGRLILDDSQAFGGWYRIDTRAFYPGVYFIKIWSGGKIHVEKLIIAR
jgi:hypothetical protein